jgi:hypothetical protein
MTRQIYVDARRLRHGPPMTWQAGDGSTIEEHQPSGALLFAGSDCGDLVGLTLRACGVPADALEGDAWMQTGEHWPDFLPRRWLTEWRIGTGLLPTICDLFDKGSELYAIAMLIGAFAGVGIRLEFVHMPEPFEVPVYNAETDGRPA